MKNTAITLVLLFLLTYGCIVKGSEYFDRFKLPVNDPPEENLFGWTELDNETVSCVFPDNRIYIIAPEQVVFFPGPGRANTSAYCQNLMKKYSEKVIIKKSISHGACDTLTGITEANWDKTSKTISFTYGIQKPPAGTYCAGEEAYYRDIWLAVDYKEGYKYEVKTAIQEPFYKKSFPEAVKKKFQELTTNSSSYSSVFLRTCKKEGDLIYHIIWSGGFSGTDYYFDALGNKLGSSDWDDISNNFDLPSPFSLEGYQCTIDGYVGPAFYNERKT
ncbi:hypothetical protein HZC08_02555 [Candidatus Micrarchaeota archaeon]|nr:hypothetical protein [Candidatus Micrarchaeota archaeon]